MFYCSDTSKYVFTWPSGANRFLSVGLSFISVTFISLCFTIMAVKLSLLMLLLLLVEVRVYIANCKLVCSVKLQRGWLKLSQNSDDNNRRFVAGLWRDFRAIRVTSATGMQVTRSTQPCIPPGSLNRVPASAGVKAGMSPLPGGR